MIIAGRDISNMNEQEIDSLIEFVKYERKRVEEDLLALLHRKCQISVDAAYERGKTFQRKEKLR